MYLSSAVRFTLSWILWTLGHLCWVILNLAQWSQYWASAWYPPYNYLMVKSCEIQADFNGEYWPWKKIGP